MAVALHRQDAEALAFHAAALRLRSLVNFNAAARLKANDRREAIARSRLGMDLALAANELAAGRPPLCAIQERRADG